MAQPFGQEQPDFSAAGPSFGSSGPNFGVSSPGASLLQKYMRKTAPQTGLGDPEFSIGRAGTNEQFPEAAAYERLTQNKERADKVAKAFTDLGIAVPKNIQAIQQGGGYQENEPGFMETVVGSLAGNPVGKGVLQGLNLLGAPARLVQTALKEVTNEFKDVQGYGNIGLSDVPDIIWGNPEKLEELTLRTGIDVTNGSQLLAMWGWKEADDGDYVGKTTRFAAHAAMEIMTDAFSYLTFGASGLSRKVLAETGDAAAQKVVREVVQGVGDTAAHQVVRKRFDDITDDLFERVMGGDTDALKKIYPNMTPQDGKRLNAQLKSMSYEAQEGLADDIYTRVVGEADTLASAKQKPGDLLTSVRDELVGPLIAKDFDNIPQEWAEHLPAYARGGMRIIRPWAVTQKGLSKGFVIPGTVGSGKNIWDATGKKITAKMRASKFPFAESKTVDDIISSIGKSTDYHRTLIKAVKDGQVTGGEYMIIQDALTHGVVNEQLDSLVPRLLFAQGDLLEESNKYIDEAGGSLLESLPKPGLAGSEAKDKVIQRQSALAQGMYEFITGKGDGLRIAGRKVRPESDLYVKATEFRDYARDVMSQYNRAIQKAIPEYTNGLENYLPFAIDSPQRAFLQQLATKAPQVAETLQKSGPGGGAEYFVGHLLNSVSFGGVAEASIGSSSHLKARTFTQSPMLMMQAEAPLLMVDNTFADAMQELLGAVDLDSIGAKQFNDLVEGKLKDLALEFNVPLPKGGHARVFNENPFDLINAYAHSMEQTLRHRNAIETLKEFGLVSNIDSTTAVQRTLTEITNRMQTPGLRERFKDISDRLEAIRESGADPKAIVTNPAVARRAAHHIRAKMTRYDDEGWASKVYDHMTPEEKVNRYLGSDDLEQVTVFRAWTPYSGTDPENYAADIFEPLGQMRAAEGGTSILNPQILNEKTPGAMQNVRQAQDGTFAFDLVDEKTGQSYPGLASDLDQLISQANAIGDRLGDPNTLGKYDVYKPQVPHAGAQSVLAHMPASRHGIVSKIKLKKNARIAPQTLTDQQANALQKAYDDFYAGAFPSLDESMDNAYSQSRDVFQATEMDFDEFYELLDFDAVRYVNGGEDAGNYSYVITKSRAIESTELVDPAEPVAWFNPKTNEWNEQPLGTHFDEGYVQLITERNEPMYGGLTGTPNNAVYAMYVDGLENMSDAERGHIQRELLRFASARQGDDVALYGTDASTPLWRGSVRKNVTQVSDETALRDAPLALQRVVRGQLSAEDDLLSASTMVPRVAARMRTLARQSRNMGDGRLPRQFDPADEVMVGRWGDDFEEFTGASIYLMEDNSLRRSLAHDGSTPYTERGLGRVISFERDRTQKNALKIIKNDFYDDLPTKVQEELLGEARWVARKSGFNRLHHQLIGSDGLSIKVEELSDYLDWDKMDDFDAYIAAQSMVQGVKQLDPSVQKSFLAWARTEFGSDFVAEVMQTTKEIVEVEARHAQFMSTVETLLRHGRAEDGTIVDATTFLSTKGDPFDKLLKSAEKQAEALGIDPKTFEPVKTTIHNQTYKFKHPVTGEVMTRNLVNPRLFGLGGPALEGELLSVELAEWFAQITDNSMALYTPIGFATFKQNMQQSTRWWKSMATVTRPTFHIRNMMGGVWNNQIIGVGPQHYAQVSTGAIKIRKAMNRGASIDEAIGTLPNRQQAMFKAAFDEGLFGNSFAVAEIKAGRSQVTTKARGALKAVNPLSVDGFGVRIGANVMESMEDMMRMSAFAAWFDPDNPATAKVAREMAFTAHFDYKNLTKFETTVKQFVPFFVWQRRNIPLQLQVLAERPGLMTRYAHLMEAAETNFQSQGQGSDLPTSEWMTAFASDTGIVLNEDTPFFARIMLDPKVPPVDLFETFDSLNPLEIASGFADNFHPLYTAAMDFQSQKDFGDVNAPAPINVVMTQLARAGLFDQSIDGDVQIPYFMRTLYNATAPFANEYSAILESGAQAVGKGGTFENDPKRLADLGVATDGDPDDNIANALSALGLTLGKGLGFEAQTPRDTAGPAFEAQSTLTDETNQGFRNVPGFEESYEEATG